MNLWLVFAFICGFAACFCFTWLAKRYALALVRSQAGKKGVEAKADAAEDLFAFIADFKASFEQAKAAGKDLKKFALEDAPLVVARHPKTAMRFGTRLYKMMQSGEGIEGILQNGLLGE